MLNKELLLDLENLAKKGYQVPKFDVTNMRVRTQQHPEWIHFGAGNIFRAFLASAHQSLLNQNLVDTGIIVVEGYDYEIIDYLVANDGLTINVTLKQDGTVDKELLASVAENIKMAQGTKKFEDLLVYSQSPSLKMMTFTITEKGYQLFDRDGKLLSDIAQDIEKGPLLAVSYLGKILTLLIKRFEAGRLPIALVSMDNMSKNGEKLRDAILYIANEWVLNKFISYDFINYLLDSSKVTFPWTMIDKITPRPNEQIGKLLEKDGFYLENNQTGKGSFIASYVNGEETQYLIIEDSFPNGRLPLDKVGIVYTDRGTVNLVETMKVTTCLNPLHTALALTGVLLGYDLISEEMKDIDLVKMITQLGYKEGMPVVQNPNIIDPYNFIREVIEVRLPNPFMPDTPQRIATDTSQKLSIRFGHTIQGYLDSKSLSPRNLTIIPFIYAVWYRYLLGIDDAGNIFEKSQDSVSERYLNFFNTSLWGKHITLEELTPFLTDEIINGVDLIEAGLADKICAYLNRMLEGPGKVRELLQEITSQENNI
ncbi:mannitol dehydrogenase family protein [Streptococcus sp. S784/96/1]|uniref:mannitol dehydrogenase family protein n=1 Tax=Streptococcus sp. S784/96/1 TaxID=2653499 RepID=UPI0013874686|nr:mannitol dehydrogenase family protein [Streptococcus sp. S784/96/1]